MRTVATVLLIGAALCVGPLYAAPTLAATMTTATTRDGTKDFNFLIGTWRTHYKRLRHPLRNSHEWYGCDGTSVVRPFWGSSANVEDGGLRCPDRYIGGMTIRLYNATSHQWSLYWATKNNVLGPQRREFPVTVAREE